MTQRTDEAEARERWREAGARDFAGGLPRAVRGVKTINTMRWWLEGYDEAVREAREEEAARQAVIDAAFVWKKARDECEAATDPNTFVDVAQARVDAEKALSGEVAALRRPREERGS